MSIATLLSQHHQVTAVDIVPEKVEMINNRKSPIQDDYIEKYLAEKELNLTATLDAKAAYSDADFVVIAAPTNYDSHTQHFDTSAVEAVIKLVMEYNPDAIMVIKSTIPVGYTASVREKFGSKNIIFSPEFLRESKALYDNLYNKPNGLNINNNAGSTHIEGLQKFVVEKGLDVGFAYDGDADRCLCVDEKGNVITGDHILYIYGCYMKERGKLLNNTVVTTVMSNFGLYKAFDEQGIGYAKTAVGDKYVYEYMAKNGCRIGGEQSGHIIFSKYASTGDGILTSLKMMEVMLAKKKPMSELAAPLKIYPQVLENVRVTDKKAAQNDEAVQTAVKKVAEGLGDTGRILVRESGTEPVVRVMVEAPDHDTCQKYVSEVVDVICEKGYKA